MLLAKVLPEVNRCPATAGAFTSYRGVVEFFHVGPLVALSLLSDSGTEGEHQRTKQNPPELLQAGERGPGRANRQRPRPCCLFVRVVVTPAGRVPISGQPDNPGHHVNVDRTSRRTNQKCAEVPQGALIKSCIYHTRRRTRGQGLVGIANISGHSAFHAASHCSAVWNVTSILLGFAMKTFPN